MPKARKIIPGVDPKLLIKDAAKLLPDPSRRLFLRGATSLGAITFLTGCDIVDQDTAAKALLTISRFNDRVQALIFNPNKLAPTYPESAITRPFPFNGYYPRSAASSRTKSRGHLRSYMHCRRRSRLRGTSASKAGAPSDRGLARRCATFLSASAPT